MIKPNPDVIKYAVERSGRDSEIFRNKWKYFDEWIEGTKVPTLTQVQKLAQMTYVPVSDLFSDTIPSYDLQIPDFRTANGRSVQPSPELYDTIMMMLWRQDWMRSFFEENGYDDVPFVMSAADRHDGDHMDIADSVRHFFAICPDWAATTRSAGEAFRLLRSRVEKMRVSVSATGHVGNNTKRKLRVDEFRGFVLADPMAPLIFVNGADADTAKCFTLFHELAHLALAQSGVVNPNEADITQTKGIERTCNAVAAELMVPEVVVNKTWNENRSDLYSYTERLSSKCRASIPVCAIRLGELHLITQSDVNRILARHEKEGHGNRAASQGGNYYASKSVELGDVFRGSIREGVKSGRISYTDAYQLTGLNRKTFDVLLEVSA